MDCAEFVQLEICGLIFEVDAVNSTKWMCSVIA